MACREITSFFIAVLVLSFLITRGEIGKRRDLKFILGQKLITKQFLSKRARLNIYHMPRLRKYVAAEK